MWLRHTSIFRCSGEEAIVCTERDSILVSVILKVVLDQSNMT